MRSNKELMDEFFATHQYDNTGDWRSTPATAADFDKLAKYSEDQPRDEIGQWTDGGGSDNKGEESGTKLSGSTDKEFYAKAAALYKEQGVKDWEQDYLGALALRSYFGNEQAFRVNESLRNGAKADARVQESIKNLEEGLGKHGVTIAQDTKVYRAVSGKFAEQLQGMKVGESFKDKGYTSTTPSVKNTERFGNTRMEITVGKSSKALVYKAEHEVLFPPGRTFTIAGSSTKGGVTTVKVKMS